MLNVSLVSASRLECGKHEQTPIAKIKFEYLFEKNDIELNEVNK